MENLFLDLLNMSITASYIVLAVILFRALLPKAPKFLRVIMWALVGIRLICPFSVESVLSLIPSANPIPQNIVYARNPAIDSGISYLNQAINPVISSSFAPNPADSANPLQIINFIAANVWVVGIVIMFLYTLISYLSIRFKVREAAVLKDNVYICDNIDTPFILGIIKPKIYLPSNLSDCDTEYVIAHEKAHLKRLDHLWKPLGFLLLTIYWFNPVLWLAYILLCKDIELACDEKVIRQMGNEIKKPYSEALISCSVPKRIISACPLAFGEIGVKGRIKSVLSYKKPTVWIIAVALICCIVLSVCFLTNPKSTAIMNIENSNLSSYLDNTLSVSKWDGETFKGVLEVDKKLLKQLLKLEISKSPVSLDRSEDGSRDTSHTIILQTATDLLSSVYSYVRGLYISFNSDFTEVYIPYGLVKPTLSYRVKDPKKAQQIYQQLITVNDLSDLKNETYNNDFIKAYIEYLGLSTQKGLEVYVWRNDSGTYESVLKSGRNLGYTDYEIFGSKPVDLDVMRAILSSYDISRNEISIIPMVHPNYKLEMDDHHKEIVEFTIFGLLSYSPDVFDDWGLKMSMHLLDENYFQVVFDHSQNHQKEAGRLTVTPEFEILAIHNGEVISFGDYMRNVLNQKDYVDKILSWDAVIYTIPSGEHYTLTDSFIGTYGKLPVGQYLLCKKVKFEDKNSNFTIRTYTSQFSITE